MERFAVVIALDKARKNSLNILDWKARLFAVPEQSGMWLCNALLDGVWRVELGDVGNSL
jgi:hypothetical protein